MSYSIKGQAKSWKHIHLLCQNKGNGNDVIEGQKLEWVEKCKVVRQ